MQAEHGHQFYHGAAAPSGLSDGLRELRRVGPGVRHGQARVVGYTQSMFFPHALSLRTGSQLVGEYFMSLIETGPWQVDAWLTISTGVVAGHGAVATAMPELDLEDRRRQEQAGWIT